MKKKKSAFFLFPVDNVSIIIDGDGKLSAEGTVITNAKLDNIYEKTLGHGTIMHNKVIVDTLNTGQVVYTGASKELKTKSTLAFNDTTDTLSTPNIVADVISPQDGYMIEIAPLAGQRLFAYEVQGSFLGNIACDVIQSNVNSYIQVDDPLHGTFVG